MRNRQLLQGRQDWISPGAEASDPMRKETHPFASPGGERGEEKRRERREKGVEEKGE